MVEIRETPVLSVLGDADALLRAHYDELATDKALMVLAPDVERYQALEAAGLLLTLGAYDGDTLVGYSCGAVMRHLHYDLIAYQNDALFLAPEHRRGGLGRQLIEATEAKARERGARFACWHAKPDTALAALLAARGDRVQDVIYSRGL